MARSQPAAQSRTARKAKNPAKSTGNNRVASSARTSSTGTGSYSKSAMSGKKPTTGISTGAKRTSSSGTKSSTNNKPSDKNHQNNRNAIKPETPPMVRKEISAILLLAFGILLFMSLYMTESAGWFGDALRVVTGGLFGVTAWGLPFLVFAQGLYRLLSRSGHPLWNRFFNVLLLFMLISAMFQAGVHPRSEYLNSSLNLLIPQFFKEGAQTLDASQTSQVLGGGVFGGILGVPLLFVFQKAGAMVVLATLGLIIALIVTRMSIMDAARSVARGTAYTFNHVVEANRRRKEARQELYQAQTLETRTTGNDKKPNHNMLKAKEAEQIKRQKGAKFLDVETYDPLLHDDSEEESGPTFHYPSAFVHYNHDVGDLRAGLDEDEEIIFDIQDPNESENGLTHSASKSTGHSLEFHNAGNMNQIDHETLENKTHNGITMNGTHTKKESQTNSSQQDFNIDYMANHELRQAKALNNNEKNAIKMPGNLLYNPVPEDVPEGKGLPHKKLGDEWEERLVKEAAERLTGKSFADIPDGFQNINLLEGRPYTFPPVMLLQESREDNDNKRRIRQTAEENARKLEATLESFGIGAKVIHISVGPAITRYELQPAPGIKVSRIVNLTDDIALNLASSGVRIEAPIPGKAAIGVEVPNKEVSPISLRSVLESKQFEDNASKLSVALGKDISGENMIIDLAKMPHLLIAGATGSGKSVCINSIIISLLFKASPDEVKLLMIDPKVVELGVYNGIPHLLIPVVTDANKAAGALRWAVQEMVLRYKIFAERGVRDLAGYNASIDESGEGMRLPQMVIIIDELADLMMVAPRDVEDSICRLAQMARAAGMHLVIATQRPSVNVITGVIKANVPSRVAFSVSSQVDSRTIIDMAGAEKLLGKGDMLYYPVGIPKPLRVKGCFISDKEVERIVEHVKGQMRVKYDEEIIDNINENLPIEESNLQDDSDELLDDAVEALIDSGQASVSFIQRRFKVGYARAGRIIDQMAERAIISGYEGSKPRRVLITRDMWNEMRMQNDIRQSDSIKNGKVNTQIPMMMKKTAEWDHIENESPDISVSPAESAFLRRAIADAASQKKTDPEDEN